MNTYKNLDGNSGITRYESGIDCIVVEFNYDNKYIYTYKSAGKSVVEKMKRLASAGRGLSTYISRTVREHFERKLE